MHPDLAAKPTPAEPGAQALLARVVSSASKLIDAHWKDWISESEGGAIKVHLEISVDPQANRFKVGIDYKRTVMDSREGEIVDSQQRLF